MRQLALLLSFAVRVVFIPDFSGWHHNAAEPYRIVIAVQDQSDTSSVKKLIVDSWDLKFSNPDEAARLAEEAWQQSREIGFKKGEADAANNLGVIYSIRGDQAKARIKKLPSENNPKKKIMEA